MKSRIKLKTILEQIQAEASLSGISRTGQMPVWDYYVARNFDAEKIYVAEGSGQIFDSNLLPIGAINKNDQIKILSPDLTVLKNRKYATIKQISTNIVGLLSINLIKKPSAKASKDKIFGSPQSKEFLPEKIGLVGKTYRDKQQLASQTITGLEKAYAEEKYNEIVAYLKECVEIASSRAFLNEGFTKKYNLSRSYKIASSDMGILSKNFGEIVAAIYILANNKQAAAVKFPDNIAAPLYDFIMLKQNGFAEYYSVKSLGGSSTSIENINFLLKNFQEGNSLFIEYDHEVDVIMNLMNNKKEGITTLTNIQNFFEKYLPEKQVQIINKLNEISKNKINSLSQIELNNWFKGMLSTASIDQFVSTMNSIYNEILADAGEGPSKAATASLMDMYNSKSSKDNGYIYYPMGSYITKYLNNTGDYLMVLNIILNYGTYVHQFNVDMYSDRFDVSIESFKTKKFRFSYNAGAKYPANRPIGFISI